MKYCPLCDARYDEEIIKFCTKDGTPLIEEESPKFIAMPSDAEDDVGEETVITRRSPEPVPEAQSERIVIPTVFPTEQNVRPRTQAYYPPPPPPPNTAKTVVLTVLGTLAVLGFGAGIFWMMQSDQSGNFSLNVNIPNQNANLNTNLGFDSNFNFNAVANFNTDFNSNFNLNTNVSTRTPTPTPRPTPAATETPEPTETPASTPRPSPTPRTTVTPRTNSNTRPPPTATPRTGPRPPQPNTNRP